MHTNVTDETLSNLALARIDNTLLNNIRINATRLNKLNIILNITYISEDGCQTAYRKLLYQRWRQKSITAAVMHYLYTPTHQRMLVECWPNIVCGLLYKIVTMLYLWIFLPTLRDNIVPRTQYNNIIEGLYYMKQWETQQYETIYSRWKITEIYYFVVLFLFV